MIKTLTALLMLTVFTPYDDVKQPFLDFLNSAQSSVRMCAYGFTDPEICDTLIKLHKRGVDVSIVMDKTQAAGKYQKGLVKRLQKEGIPLFIGKSAVKNQLIHAKFVVIDEDKVEDGSWNYSNSASMQDNTLNFSFNDPDRAKRFTKFWQMIHDKEKKVD